MKLTAIGAAVAALGLSTLTACVTTPQTDLTQAVKESLQPAVDTFFEELDERLGKPDPAMLWPLSEDWRFGYWATVGDEQLFTAFLVDGSDAAECLTECVGFWEPEVWGEPSGTNPIAGSATWSGRALAGVVGSAFPPTEGAILLHTNWNISSIDVYLTDVGPAYLDRSWRNVPLIDGTFKTTGWQLEGAFYGTAHAGAAGTFYLGNLVGIFGAVRE